MLAVFIIIVFLLVVFSFLRFDSTIGKFKLITILAVILILMLSVVFWVGTGDADFSSPKAVAFSVLNYFSWAKSTGMAILSTGADAFSNIGGFLTNNKTTTQKTKDKFDGRR